MADKDAVALIEEAAREPTLDELAKRARRILALAAPTALEEEELAAYYRADRVAWGAKQDAKAKEDEEDEE